MPMLSHSAACSTRRSLLTGFSSLSCLFRSLRSCRSSARSSASSSIRVLAFVCASLVAACTGENSGTDSTDSASSQSSSSSSTGDGAERTTLCESLCGEAAPAEICGLAPSDCVTTCTELGPASCIDCRLDTLGWQGTMACGFTPCSFSDVAGYDACAANCDLSSTTCDFVLDAAIDPKCTEFCN